MGMFNKKVAEAADRPLPAGEGSSIGAGCMMEGRFVFSGPMMVRGHIKGDIRSRHMLVVEAGGIVEGRINVPSLVVQGTVTGSVAASESIEVWTGAELGGDVYTPSLKVDSGSKLTADVITASERPSDHIDRAAKMTFTSPNERPSEPANDAVSEEPAEPEPVAVPA